METLSSSFLKELIKLSLYKKDVIEVISNHLKFEYLPKNYKPIIKNIVNFYQNNNKIPTIGVLSQLSERDESVQEILKHVGEIKLPDKDTIIKQLEEYIKKARFQILYDNIADLYNSDRQDEALQLQAKESAEIVNFSIYKGSNRFENIFGDFFKRQSSRVLKKMLEGNIHDKIPYGVDDLDLLTDGGTDITETELFIARSGTGKSTWLRWRAISAARRGYKVLHIQAEGSKEKCLEAYDRTWSALLLKDLKSGNISQELEIKFEKVIQDIRNKNGEISIVAFESFGTASMLDVRNIVIDYIKINGKAPDLIVIDYLEKLNPGDGRRYPVSTEGEKMRREATADKMKNLAVEFNSRVSTASQANDIAPTEWNNPSWTMTRHNVSGAKGLVDSFSYIYTWNTTRDEYTNNVGRIYIDKFRDYKISENVIKIATCFDNGRFYDRSRTIELFFKKDK